VERHLLSERDLWKAVQEHVTTVFQAILLETRGEVVLADERHDDTLSVPGLSAEGLLMEGVRRLDELRVLRSGGDGEPARVLAAFKAAFRDIFATASRRSRRRWRAAETLRDGALMRRVSRLTGGRARRRSARARGAPHHSADRRGRAGGRAQHVVLFLLWAGEHLSRASPRCMRAGRRRSARRDSPEIRPPARTSGAPVCPRLRSEALARGSDSHVMSGGKEQRRWRARFTATRPRAAGARCCR
jgi:hypothetical protein